MPIYLNGLGTVQPPNVVEIKAQVTGTLIALPVKEGAEVHEGDIVAEIDPRPFKAALDQAMAQRDEDTALLKSAQLDLNASATWPRAASPRCSRWKTSRARWTSRSARSGR